MEEVSRLISQRAGWPLVSTLIFGVLLAAFATTGFRQVFVQEMLGSAYDSQAEHFLRGNVDVDGDDIKHEVMVVDHQSRMYFGPFPAFLRIPLNFIHPAGRGRWSRLSGLCAGILALAVFAGLVADALKSSPVSGVTRAWLGSACVAGFALASPLLFLLGNLSIYNEAVIWGLAGSVAALFFANRARVATGRKLIAYLLGFSFSGAAALLSRVTFGLPLLFIGPLLFLGLPNKRSIPALAALFLPFAAGVAAYALLSYARFGTWTGVDFAKYINPVYREFAAHHSMFNLRRVPCSLIDYFSLRFPEVQSTAPFLKGARHAAPCRAFYPMPTSESYLSIIWSSTWLIAGAIGGLIFLFRRNQSDPFQRGTAAAFLVEFVLVLSYFALAQRYAADLYPFLIACLLVFLASRSQWLNHAKYAVIVLVVVSVAINTATTISWMADADQNVPTETRNAWRSVLGLNHVTVSPKH